MFFKPYFAYQDRSGTIWVVMDNGKITNGIVQTHPTAVVDFFDMTSSVEVSSIFGTGTSGGQSITGKWSLTSNGVWKHIRENGSSAMVVLQYGDTLTADPLLAPGEAYRLDDDKIIYVLRGMKVSAKNCTKFPDPLEKGFQFVGTVKTPNREFSDLFTYEGLDVLFSRKHQSYVYLGDGDDVTLLLTREEMGL